MSQNQLCLSRRTSRLIIHRFLLLNGLCDISLCVCVCLPSLAGSWTIWSTTWSWKSRTVRAGKATQLASIATGNTWHHSSCSATLRVLTAQSNPQVWSKIRSIQVSMTRQFSQKLIWNFLSLFQPIARYASWRLSLSKFSWSTWRKTTSPGKCPMCARSVTSYWILVWFNVSREAFTETEILFYWFHRSAITGPLSSQMWRRISGMSMKTQKTCSVPSASKFLEVVICTCNITWNIRYVATFHVGCCKASKAFLKAFFQQLTNSVNSQDRKYCIYRSLKSLLVCAISSNSKVGLMWLSAKHLTVINKRLTIKPASLHLLWRSNKPNKQNWLPIY